MLAPMQTVLVVCHCPSSSVTTLRDHVAAGAREGCGADHRVRVLSPFDTQPDDVLESAGLILGTTENFGYMNGALKDFFERIYYPCLDQTRGRPYALFVKAGQDGIGARDSVQRIVTGLGWCDVAAPLIMTGKLDEAWLAHCHELGMTLTAGLDAGVF